LPDAGRYRRLGLGRQEGPADLAMRCLLLLVLAAACKPGGVSGAQETCAKAGAMFEKCEDFGSATPLQHDLMVDRWRGLCRAVFTGETKQLMPNALEVWQSLD